MLPRSFAPLVAVEPRLSGVFKTLDLWLQTHTDWRWLVPGIVARDCPYLDAFDLAEALGAAVRQGLLRVEYTVVTPSGVLADESFESPTSIPRELADRQEHYFRTELQPVVPVYMLSETASRATRKRPAPVR
jgi:hypothetical protein